MPMTSVLIGLVAVTLIFASIKIIHLLRNKNETQTFSAEKEILKLQQEAERQKKAFNLKQDQFGSNTPSDDIKNKQVAQLALLMQRLSNKQEAERKKHGLNLSQGFPFSQEVPLKQDSNNLVMNDRQKEQLARLMRRLANKGED